VEAAGVYKLILNKYYIDELYDLLFVRPTLALSDVIVRVIDGGVIDGLVNGTARPLAPTAAVRGCQTGNVQHYAVSMLLGALAILGYYAWRDGSQRRAERARNRALPDMKGISADHVGRGPSPSRSNGVRNKARCRCSPSSSSCRSPARSSWC